MSLRFILGRAGYGKTKYIYESIRSELLGSNDGPAVLVLVPEQAAFRTEREILSGSGLAGSFRLRVTGFSRLAAEVLKSVGGASGLLIDEQGKRMLLRDRLSRRCSELEVFRHADSGTVDRLAATISELHRYRITSKDLAEHCDTLSFGEKDGRRRALLPKMRELALIYGDFEECLRQSRYMDPDDALDLAAAAVGRWHIGKGAFVYIDGFTGFTPQELAMIEALLETVSKMNVALSFPPDLAGRKPKNSGIFSDILETYNSLKGIADKPEISIEPPVLLQPSAPLRFSKPTLIHLERFYPGYNRTPFQGMPDGLHLRAAANPRAEVEWVAREIIRLCRDQGYRWRDCAVIARNLEDYADLIRAVFDEAGIPCFIDRRHPVNHHPLVGLLRSAVELQITDWSYEAVFSCLKTDIFPLDRDDCDVLENYVLAHGIRGRRSWLDMPPWTYRAEMLREKEPSDTEAGSLESEQSAHENPETNDQQTNNIPGEHTERLLDRVNRARDIVADNLRKFCSDFAEGLTVRRACLAVYDLLERLQVREILERWYLEAMEFGHIEEAEEHAGAWGKIIGLLDQMMEFLDETEISPRAFLELLEAALQSVDLGLIPPGMDAAVAGSIDRARFPHIKAAFVIGLNDGSFPALPGEDMIFSDTDRRLLKEGGLKLAPSSREQLLRERYFAYMALTRASEYLSLSYSLADAEGRSRSLSSVVTHIKELFPGLRTENWPIEPGESQADGSAEDFIIGREEALFYLISRLETMRSSWKESGQKGSEKLKPQGLWIDLYRLLLDASGSGRERKLLQSLNHTNRAQPLSESVMAEMVGPVLHGSVSSLERFTACPFSYYASHLLGLKERSVFKMEAVHAGVFRHAAMRDFVLALQENGLDWGELGPEEAAEIMGRICEELIPRLQNEILLSSNKYRYLADTLTAVMQRIAVIYTEAARQTAYRPVGVELEFGYGQPLPSLSIKLSGGRRLELEGRIDRVDAAPSGEWRIIDYKGSERLRLDPADVMYGLSLQLTAYAALLQEYGRRLHSSLSVIGGLFYAPLHDPPLRADGPWNEESVAREYRKRLKMNGLFSEDTKHILDRKLAPGQESLLVNLSLKKDGNPVAHCGAVSVDRLRLLADYTRISLAEIGNRVLQGQPEIAPFRRGNSTACTYCEFKPICAFDSSLPDNNWRRLDRVFREQAFNAMADRIYKKQSRKQETRVRIGQSA